MVAAALVALAGFVLPSALADSASAATKRAKPITISLSTDKAVYKPGDSVKVNIQVNNLLKKDSKTASIVVFNLADSVSKATVKLSAKGAGTYTWQAPSQDFQGYLLTVTAVKVPAAIGIDVSSDWNAYPRYGFLSEFGKMTKADQAAIIDDLTRFHINALQFYDWQDAHNAPLPSNNGKVADTWNDIAGRPTALATVQNYISLAHAKGMKAMNYNLINGSYDPTQAPDVQPEWGLYTDIRHKFKDLYPLPNTWESNLYLQNPANTGWQDYLIQQEADVQDALPFDGWHVDQLGNRGLLYDYTGKSVSYVDGYASFLKAAKRDLDYDLVMNAVDGFAQKQILGSGAVKVAYTEAWDNGKTFAQLKAMIDNNYALSSGKLSSVLAAYMNYDKSKDSGATFNANSVLLADAFIFASGASHIELGEHMLANEYFPNKNVAMSPDLKAKLVAYYDFAVAYEKILTRTSADLTDTAMYISASSDFNEVPKAGTLFAFNKITGNHLVTQVVNLTGATSNEWRDNAGNFKAPKLQKNVLVTLHTDKVIKNAWIASPDGPSIAPVKVDFIQAGNTVKVNIPTMTFWTMAVLDF